MKHSKPNVGFSILVVIQLFRSVSSRPYRKDGLFVVQICNSLRGLYLVNKLVTMAEGNLHSNSWKAVLVLYCMKTDDKHFLWLQSACLREKTSCDHYYKIVTQVEIGMRD